MTECTQIQWTARTAAWLGEGDAILGAPRRNVRHTSALTPPALGDGGPIMTHTIEAEAPEPVDIKRMLDDMEAFQAAQTAARHRYVEAAMKMVVDLSERGQDEKAFAILRLLFPPEPFWAMRYMPDDRRRS